MTDTELDTPRARTEAVLSPRQNLLPRSVIRNNTFVLLDGQWRFDKEDPEQWSAALDRFASGENEGVTVLPLVIGDPFFYGGQAPLVVSEWGGFGFPMYGGPQDLDARANRIHTFKQELAGRPIAGDVYTQATSIEDETNGLINSDTGELMVPAQLLSSVKLEKRTNWTLYFDLERLWDN